MKLSRARWVWPVAFAAVAAFTLGCGASQADGNGAGASADQSAVAKIGDQVITSAQLDEEIRKTDMKAYQAYYDARKKALDQMIAKQLVDAELASRGINEQELQAEVTASVAAVTQAEIEAFFAQNQAQMGGRPLEQMGPQISQFLTQQRMGTVMSDFLKELRTKAGVTVLLDVPRIEVKVAANDPKKGPEGAPITLIEFSDFQ